jgi:hypothetical protein
MNAQRQIRFFINLLFSIAVIWTIGATQIAQASSILPHGILANGEVIENDVFTTGENVLIDGTIQGDAFILGNQVQINGTVDGSLFVIGQDVSIQGEVTGTTYVAALSLELGEQAVLERNLYFVGASLTTQAGSAIQRDLNTLCLSADLKGDTSRNTRAIIGALKLIEGAINRFGGEVLSPQSNLQPGLVVTPRVFGGLVSALFAGFYPKPDPVGSIDTAALTAWLGDRLRDFGLLLMLGALFYWLFRDPINRTAQALRERPMPALGFGLVALLITTNIFLVGLLVASLIFVIGLWFGYLGLWSFTLGFWALTYGALVFLLAALWFLIAYGTKLVVAYLAGRWLLGKIAPKASISPFIGLVIGLLIYILLLSIPMLGWVLSVLVTAWGLGGFWLAYRKHPEQGL